MKIRTNLTATQLEKIAKGIKVAADKQTKPYTPENAAERELLQSADGALDLMLDSLQKEVAALLLGTEKGTKDV